MLSYKVWKKEAFSGFLFFAESAIISIRKQSVEIVILCGKRVREVL